jgi:hypothetical protein
VVATDGAKVKRYFTKKQIAELRLKHATIEKKTDNLLLKFVYFPLKNEQAKHYAQQGFARRVQLLRRCIDNVFKIIPPGTVTIPSKARLYDAEINIQAFLANLYGIVDNLAWIWVYESGLSDSIPRRHVGLGRENKAVRNSLSVKLQTYLDTIEGWFEYLTEFRHALAHRIPVYIPPGMVRADNVDKYNAITMQMTNALNQMRPREYDRLSEEQNKLLVFQPLIAHSTRETKAPFVFHAQLIADFLTIEALGEKILEELRSSDPSLSL